MWTEYVFDDERLAATDNDAEPPIPDEWEDAGWKILASSDSLFITVYDYINGTQRLVVIVKKEN